MPVQIGAKSHDFTNPLGLLSDCHRRIEMFLGALTAVGKRIDEPADPETRRALETALRYFRESGPKHTADEEESLFPRLRKMQRDDLQSAFATMDALEEEHKRAEELHAEVDRLGSKYLAHGGLPAPEISRFRADIAELSLIYREHIRVEDEVLFRIAGDVLPEDQKLAVAQEMAARRSVNRTILP